MPLRPQLESVGSHWDIVGVLPYPSGGNVLHVGLPVLTITSNTLNTVLLVLNVNTAICLDYHKQLFDWTDQFSIQMITELSTYELICITN